jgi:hypothetical protein
MPDVPRGAAAAGWPALPLAADSVMNADPHERRDLMDVRERLQLARKAAGDAWRFVKDDRESAWADAGAAPRGDSMLRHDPIPDSVEYWRSSGTGSVT